MNLHQNMMENLAISYNYQANQQATSGLRGNSVIIGGVTPSKKEVKWLPEMILRAECQRADPIDRLP